MRGCRHCPFITHLVTFGLRNVRSSSPLSSAISPTSGRVFGPSTKSWEKEYYFQRKRQSDAPESGLQRVIMHLDPDSSWFHSMDDHMRVLIPERWPFFTFQCTYSLRSTLRVRWVYFQNWYFFTCVYASKFQSMANTWWNFSTYRSRRCWRTGRQVHCYRISEGLGS